MLYGIVLLILLCGALLVAQLVWEGMFTAIGTWAFRRREDGSYSVWQICWQAFFGLLALFMVGLFIYGVMTGHWKKGVI